MTKPPHLLFGGKSPKALEFDHPLPHMQEYLDDLARERAANYVSVCRMGMIHFSAWAHSEGIRHPEEIHRTHLLHYQAHLATLTKDGEPLSLSYRQQLMKYLRAWINWLDGLEYITSNPWQKIRVGSVKKLPNPLEDEEVALLFDAHRRQAFVIHPFFYHRRETMLVLFYGWGLRIGELASLTTSQMDTRLNEVTVRNKSQAGSANRLKRLPYGPETKLVVSRYVNLRATYAEPGDDGLFIDQQGKAMTTHHIRKIVVDLGKRAGIDINPHRLRDTCATTLVDSGVDIELVMKILGHTKREQTLAYTRIHDRRVNEAHEVVMGPLVQHLTQGAL